MGAAISCWRREGALNKHLVAARSCLYAGKLAFLARQESFLVFVSVIECLYDALCIQILALIETKSSSNIRFKIVDYPIGLSLATQISANSRLPHGRVRRLAGEKNAQAAVALQRSGEHVEGVEGQRGGLGRQRAVAAAKERILAPRIANDTLRRRYVERRLKIDQNPGFDFVVLASANLPLLHEGDA